MLSRRSMLQSFAGIASFLTIFKFGNVANAKELSPELAEMANCLISQLDAKLKVEGLTRADIVPREYEVYNDTHVRRLIQLGFFTFIEIKNSTLKTKCLGASVDSPLSKHGFPTMAKCEQWAKELTATLNNYVKGDDSHVVYKYEVNKDLAMDIGNFIGKNKA